MLPTPQKVLDSPRNNRVSLPRLVFPSAVPPLSTLPFAWHVAECMDEIAGYCMYICDKLMTAPTRKAWRFVLRPDRLEEDAPGGGALDRSIRGEGRGREEGDARMGCFWVEAKRGNLQEIYAGTSHAESLLPRSEAKHLTRAVLPESLDYMRKGKVTFLLPLHLH